MERAKISITISPPTHSVFGTVNSFHHTKMVSSKNTAVFARTKLAPPTKETDNKSKEEIKALVQEYAGTELGTESEDFICSEPDSGIVTIIVFTIIHPYLFSPIFFAFLAFMPFFAC